MRGMDASRQVKSFTPAQATATPAAHPAKAITAAYLSSEGNAFSTRTASQIVQEHFNPGEFGGPSGPIFGVPLARDGRRVGQPVVRFRPARRERRGHDREKNAEENFRHALRDSLCHPGCKPTAPTRTGLC